MQIIEFTYEPYKKKLQNIQCSMEDKDKAVNAILNDDFTNLHLKEKGNEKDTYVWCDNDVNLNKLLPRGNTNA